MARIALLKDVAAAANVSVSTVSRHLNKSIQLPDETRRRIDAAIERLGYTPNPLARSLSRGRTETLGLVVPEIANPFFARLAAEVEIAAAAKGYGVMLCITLNRLDREVDYIRRLARKHVDGLLFVTNHPDDGTLLAAIEGSQKIVLLDEDIAGADVSRVFANNVEGARRAVQHMVAAGHRSIAMISGPPGLLSADERREGFLQAIREAGPDCRATTVLSGPYAIEHGRAAAHVLLRDHPETTAVFTGSDEIFLGMLETFRAAGVRLGQQMSVVTCDDVGPLALFEPPITALRQNLQQMGRAALELVVGQIEGTGSGRACERVPMDLVIRDSVQAPWTSLASRRRRAAGRD